MKLIKLFVQKYYLFLINILIGFILFMCIGQYFNLQMTKIPFDSGIWGTVSDWTMVLITGITAYFLWKTLRSQTDVQQLQSKLTELEFERYRESILPKWKLMPKIQEIKIGNKSNYTYEFEFELIHGTAYNVILTTNSYGFSIPHPIIFEQGQMPYVSTNQKYRIAATYDDFIKTDGIGKCIASIEIKIIYNDKMKNKYHHSLCYCLFSDGQFMDYTTDPIHLFNTRD